MNNKSMEEMIEEATKTRRQGQDVCPDCGRCPTCDRRKWPRPLPPFDPIPYNPPYPYRPVGPYWQMTENFLRR